MQKLKDLVKKKKLDNKFKKLGGGHKLGGPASQQRTEQAAGRNTSSTRSPSPGAQQRRSDAELIAAAAEKRMHGKQQNDPNAGLTPMQKMVRMQAKKELEDEQRRLAQQQQQPQQSGGGDGGSVGPQRPVDQQRRNHTSTVRYTCEIFDEDMALPKSEMYNAIECTLYEHMADEPLSASVWMLHTLCRDDEQRSAALETIRKYLQNIIDHPNEQKYRQIRLSNRVFAEKVLPVKGTIEFLKAIGFREEMRAAPATDGQQQSAERYLVLSAEPTTGGVDRLRNALATLLDGKPITIRVFREAKVFKIESNQQQLSNPEIPPDFFKRTVEEIQREQQRMSEELEKIMTLRTRKMREADTKRKDAEGNPFKYCYIRVRFPNSFVLQGIFNVHERFANVREFVAQHLAIHHGTFTLTAALGEQQQLREEEHTLLDYELVPSALIHFQWDTETRASLSQTGQPFPYLLPELEASAQSLH
ncbi:hypothetical protein niasHT_037817 [Heterodera trifolii]|uniref:UBX domain-containing protein n=1 Tax=Heterodera trifolii TaxID=157864 RepID=A0ABD2IQ61_9BILA